MRSLSNVTMLDLLPSTMRNDPDAIAASQAIAPDYWRLRQLADKVIIASNVDSLAEDWLDELANDLHVDFYNSRLPIEQKRQLVKQSSLMHQRKGTPWAVEELVRIVFGVGHVEEWFEYGGEPYHFRVYSSNHLATPEDARKFKIALESVKNLRSVLDEILILRTWGEVIERDYLTWQGVLNTNYWGDLLQSAWQTVSKKTWGALLGGNTWGNVYSYVWEEAI